MTWSDMMERVHEVVSGQIRLSHRAQFFKLHSTVLLPIMRDVGVRPVKLLITEIGHYGRFLDIYAYNNLAEYEELTDRLLQHPSMPKYYEDVGQCISGSIEVQIMQELPYAAEWVEA
ncbi:hypothetical protein GAY29_14280 [Azospirillum brasilense]|uniref:NIPSNAP family protein n=1 Tax=Azospirillum brasilense TaxID=192 RepID=UPI001909445C|nr:hypothetical protein [Azospirillum brasilense]